VVCSLLHCCSNNLPPVASINSRGKRCRVAQSRRREPFLFLASARTSAKARVAVSAPGVSQGNDREPDVTQTVRRKFTSFLGANEN
jgi:hypothetical protein